MTIDYEYTNRIVIHLFIYIYIYIYIYTHTHMNYVQKLLRLKFYSSKQKLTKNEILTFIRISEFNTPIPASFPLVEAPLKLLF